jgi:GNAT superfamily N-acetyltransferase
MISGAIKEAAHTLAESLLTSRPIYDDALKITSMFKNMIDTASIQSRDFAMQVEGCKGVLIWSDERSQPLFTSWSQHIVNVSKCANKLFGHWSMKPFVKTGDKLRRKCMTNFRRYLIIGYVGVLSQEQNKGLGTALVECLMDKADSCHYPIYVEATDNTSVRFFEKLGFVPQGQYPIAKEQTLTPMIRYPSVMSEAKTLQIRPGRRDSS